MLEEGLERLGGHAAAGADVDGLELAVLEQLIDLERPMPRVLAASVGVSSSLSMSSSGITRAGAAAG